MELIWWRTLLHCVCVDRWEVLEGESGEPTAPEPRIGARKTVAAIADVLVPPLCLSCHERLSTHDALCPACWSGIDFIRAPLCAGL